MELKQKNTHHDTNPCEFPLIKTERCLLRALSRDDDNEIFLIRSDERVLRYIDMVKAESITDAQEFIKKIEKAIAEKKSLYWAVTFTGNSKLTGTICLWNFNEQKTEAEIGYALLPEYFGQGIMQEVMPAIIGYGFTKLNLQSILADVHPDNLKSVHLLKKFGFVPVDGNDHQQTPEENMYHLRRSEWEGSVSLKE